MNKFENIEDENKINQDMNDSLNTNEEVSEKENEVKTEKENEETNEDNKNKEEDINTKYSKLYDDYLRLVAEYDNYRKRTLKEKSELIRNGGEKVLVELLPVVDDFEMALKNMPKQEEFKSIIEGIELIHSKFIEYLSKQGVKEIESLNQNFDEEKHEAIAVIPATDEENKGKIIDTLKKGYTLNDKVIRHSSVVVSQ